MPEKTPESSRIVFHGPGPFDLPVTQSASAAPQNKHVVLTLRMLVEGDCQPVRTVVLNNQALELAAQILRAVIQANAEE